MKAVGNAWQVFEMLNPCQWALAGMTAAGSPKGAMSGNEQVKY
jgi:hypothetical protein